ncbi:hypothetical protein [Deinococcus maricopensis]|nr:hypothetical protein [Deinococcus maricopensis]
MIEDARVRLVRELRREAQHGVSSTQIARALLAREDIGRMDIYGLVMDAFRMGLREARECEWLLADAASEVNGNIERVGSPFLRDPTRWPKRTVWVEQEHAQLVVTLRLFEYQDAQDHEVIVAWGDEGRVTTTTSSLPLSHVYAQAGTYAFHCIVGQGQWVLNTTLQLAHRPEGGKHIWILRNPW